MDPFAVLGIERKYDVDLASVEKTHRELSRTVHPDRHASEGASARREALSHAVEINEAFRIVRDPIKRAEALFALAGVPVGENVEPKPAPDFLMEMLEMREALSDARAAKDLAAVDASAKAIAERRRDTEKALAAGFANGDLRALVGKLGELRFYARFLEEADALSEELR